MRVIQRDLNENKNKMKKRNNKRVLVSNSSILRVTFASFFFFHGSVFSFFIRDNRLCRWNEGVSQFQKNLNEKHQRAFNEKKKFTTETAKFDSLNGASYTPVNNVKKTKY